MRKNQWALLALLSLLVSPLSSFAAPSEDVSLSALGGASMLSGNIGTKFAWGARLNKRFGDNADLGVIFTFASLKSASDKHTDDELPGLSDANLKLIQGNFAVRPASLPEAWFAARAGLGLLSITVPTNTRASVDTTVVAFAWGPAAGYDYMITPNFGLGVDLSYNLMTFISGSVGNFQALGAVGYHF
jgi:hypothetical protein